MRWSVSVDLYSLYVLRGRGFLVVPLMDVMFRSGELEVTLLGNLVRRFFEAGGERGLIFNMVKKFSHRPAQKSSNYVTISYKLGMSDTFPLQLHIIFSCLS